MNKKRVALALAAALGVNTLIVTVGPSFGGQVVVAHAQESRLITGSEAEKRLAGIGIKTLKTHVETSSNNEVTLTFDGLTVDNVSDVSGTLSYTKFDERTNDTNGSVTLHWDSSTGKAKVSGMNAPGIYSGDVTVIYKNGDKETYNLTLRKTYEKDVLTADVTVGVGTIEVKNVKFGDSDVFTSSNETLELYLSGQSQPIDTINTSDDTKFTVPNMSEGQVYNLVYKKGGVEQGRTQIVLTKQAQPTVRAYASNSSDIDSLGSIMSEDFGVSAVSTTTTNYQNANSRVDDVKNTFRVNGEVVLEYDQSQTRGDNVRIGGAKINVSSNSTTDSNINVGIGGDSVNFLYLDNGSGTNFLPSMWMKYGPLQADTNEEKFDARLNGMYGVVKVSLDGESKQLFDASSKISNVQAKVVEINQPQQSYQESASDQSKKYAVLDVTGVVKPTEAINLSLDTVNFDYDTSGLSHGYNSVDVIFTAESTPFYGKNLASWASDVRSLSVGDVTLKLPEETSINKEEKEFNTGHTKSPVKASLIVVKDSLEGAVVNSSFEKISSSEGKLVLSNGDKLLEGTDANTLARKLIVQGSSSVSYIERDSDGNLVFRVQFNGQVPSSIRWTLDKLGSTIDVTSVDAVNFDGEVKPSNSNTDKLESYFEISAKFGSTVPADASSLEIDNLGSTRVTFDQLNDGAHTISTKVTSGNYQGTYSAGIWVNKNLFTLEARDVKSVSNTSASLVIDANFFNTSDIEKVTGGVVQYSQKTTNGDTTTWSDWKDTTTNIEKSEVKEDAITKTVTGLSSGGTYKFRVVYDFSNGGTTGKVYSNETSEITLPTSSSSSTITGSGSSSSTSGTSTGSTTVNVTTSNSTTAGTSASVSLPSGFRYDSGKTPVIVGFKHKDSNGNTVTESKEQYSNVTVRFENGQVVLDGLVPGKDYTEISVDYTDTNGNTRTLILKGIKTTSQTTLEDYLANVYSVVFGRPADESGYHFHLKNLKDEKVALREFLLNILNEKEFLEIYKTTESKIEALYNAIVARSSDEEGKKFWVDEYKKVLAVYGSESTALKAIADRMVNENELKEIADKMRVKW